MQEGGNGGAKRRRFPRVHEYYASLVWLPCIKGILNGKKKRWISVKIYGYMLKSIHVYRYILNPFSRMYILSGYKTRHISLLDLSGF